MTSGICSIVCAVLADPHKKAIYDTTGIKGLETDGWEVHIECLIYRLLQLMMGFLLRSFVRISFA